MPLINKPLPISIISSVILVVTSSLYADQSVSNTLESDRVSSSDNQSLQLATFKEVYINFDHENNQLMTQVHDGDSNQAMPLGKALQHIHNNSQNDHTPTVILQGLTGVGANPIWYAGKQSNSEPKTMSGDTVKEAVQTLSQHNINYVISSGGPQTHVNDNGYIIADNPIWVPFAPDDAAEAQQNNDKPKLEKIAEQYQNNGHLKGFNFTFDYGIYESLYRAKITMEQVVKMQQWRAEHDKPWLRISITLPVRGVDAHNVFTHFDYNVISKIKQGLDYANWYVVDEPTFKMKDLHLNLLASNYRHIPCMEHDGKCDMAKLPIAAIQGVLHRDEVKTIPKHNISITPMIGYNTTLEGGKNAKQFLSTDDMQQIAEYAQDNDLSSIHFTYTRDIGCKNSDDNNPKGFPERCNGTDYKPLTYYNTVLDRLNS